MGYELVLLEKLPDEDLICIVCEKVLEDPKQLSDCEHNICNECLEHTLLDSLEGGKRFECPACSATINLKRIRPSNSELRHRLDSFPMKCRFYREGCQVHGTIEEMRKHMKECAHAIQANGDKTDRLHTKIMQAFCSKISDLEDEIESLKSGEKVRDLYLNTELMMDDSRRAKFLKEHNFEIHMAGYVDKQHSTLMRAYIQSDIEKFLVICRDHKPRQIVQKALDIVQNKCIEDKFYAAMSDRDESAYTVKFRFKDTWYMICTTRTNRDPFPEEDHKKYKIFLEKLDEKRYNTAEKVRNELQHKFKGWWAWFSGSPGKVELINNKHFVTLRIDYHTETFYVREVEN